MYNYIELLQKTHGSQQYEIMINPFVSLGFLMFSKGREKVLWEKMG